MARPALPAQAPANLCGYAVLEATARPAGNVRNMDGTVVHYAGVARLAHPNGTQTVVWYDESAWQVMAEGRFGPMYGQGVDNVCRWVSPTRARARMLAILAETV